MEYFYLLYFRRVKFGCGMYAEQTNFGSSDI